LTCHLTSRIAGIAAIWTLVDKNLAEQTGKDRAAETNTMTNTSKTYLIETDATPNWRLEWRYERSQLAKLLGVRWLECRESRKVYKWKDGEEIHDGAKKPNYTHALTMTNTMTNGQDLLIEHRLRAVTNWRLK